MSTSLLLFKCFRKLTKNTSWKGAELWSPCWVQLWSTAGNCVHWQTTVEQAVTAVTLSQSRLPLNTQPSSPPLIPFTFRLSWQDYCAFSFLLLGVQISELIQAPVALCAHKPCYQLQSWLWLICVSPRLKVTQTVPGSAWAAVCPLPFALQSHVLSLLTQSHQEFFKNIFSDAN